MLIMVCPNCKMRVLPNADGTCPSCHTLITEPEPVPETAAPPAPVAPVVRTSKRGKIGDMIWRAWQLTLDHRRLWLLGFFAAISLGGAGLSSILLQFVSWAFVGSVSLTAFQIVMGIAYPLGMLLFWIIGTGAAIGIIYEIAAAVRQPAEPPLTIRELIQKSRTFFPKVVLMIALVWSPYMVLMSITYAIMVPTLTSMTADAQAGVMPNLGAFGATWLLGCCTSLLSVLLAAVDVIAQRSLILENLGILSSIQRAWQVIRQNLGTLIALGLVIAVLGFVVGLVTQLVTLPMLFVVSQPMTQVARDCALQSSQPSVMVNCMSQANSNLTNYLTMLGFQAFFVGFYALVSALPTVFNSALLTVAYTGFENKPKSG